MQATHNKKDSSDFSYLAIYGIIILLVILVGSSCAAHRAKMCALCPVVTKDSLIYKDKIVPHDTTIYITQRISEPIYLDSPCKDLCDSLGKLKIFDIKKKSNGITSEVKSVGNSIEFECKADSLSQVITILQHEKTTVSHTENTRTIETNKLTKLQGFWIISGYLFWILILIIIVRFIIKFYFKI